MPIYDCGAPECEECQRAFGPDRSRAIAEYEAKLKAFSSPKRSEPASVSGSNHPTETQP